MNIKAALLQSLEALPLLVTTAGVLVAVITITFRNSSTDDTTKQRTAWGSVIAVSAGVQIIMAIIAAFWFTGPVAAGTTSSLWKVLVANGAAAVAIVYAGFLMSNRDSVALGAATIIATAASLLLKAARQFSV